MTRRRAEFLAWGLWGLCMLVLVVSETPLFPQRGAAFSLDDLLTVLPFVLFATVGAIVAARRPDNRLGWLYLVIGLLASFTAIGGSLENVNYPPSGPGRLALVLLYAVTNLAWYPTLGLLATLSILWFPDGRPPSPHEPCASPVPQSMALALLPGTSTAHSPPANQSHTVADTQPESK